MSGELLIDAMMQLHESALGMFAVSVVSEMRDQRKQMTMN